MVVYVPLETLNFTARHFASLGNCGHLFPKVLLTTLLHQIPQVGEERDCRKMCCDHCLHQQRVGAPCLHLHPLGAFFLSLSLSAGVLLIIWIWNYHV